jgi:hypothetical protein
VRRPFFAFATALGYHTTRATQLHDRRSDEVNLDEAEKIGV